MDEIVTYTQFANQGFGAEYERVKQHFLAYQVAEILVQHGLPTVEDLVEDEVVDHDFLVKVYGEHGTTARDVMENAVVLLKCGAESAEQAISVLTQIGYRFYRAHPTLGYASYRPPIDGEPGSYYWDQLVGDLENYFEDKAERATRAA